VNSASSFRYPIRNISLPYRLKLLYPVSKYLKALLLVFTSR
jgi:hypothetical protein